MTHPGDPLTLFGQAFTRAQERELFEANAMSLATVDGAGRPSVRIVLLKGIDERGLSFFTNRESRKGQELDAQKVAALCFHWPKGEEQVRFEGTIERVTDDESDAYFATRHPRSQAGAWASQQSRPLTDRAAFEAAVDELLEKHGSEPIARPPHWGGYRLVPLRCEFWYGRPNRLHERHVYERDAEGDAFTYTVLFP